MSVAAPGSAPFDLGVVAVSGPILDLEGARRGEDLISKAELAENLGYRWFGLGEHVFFHDETGTWNAFVALSYVASRVHSIELLTGVTIVPLYSSGLLAKLVSSIDVLSDGRFNLGVGVGGEFPAEFDACGVPTSERGARTDETLEMLRALATGKQVDIDGKFASIHGRLNPPPVRVPPVWVGGRGRAAIRRTARFGDVWMPLMVTNEQVRQGMAELATEAVAMGRTPHDVSTVPFCFLNAGPDHDTAVRQAIAFMNNLYQQDFTDRIHRYVVAGDAQHCADRLRELRDMGCVGTVITPICAADKWDELVEFVAREVQPLI